MTLYQQFESHVLNRLQGKFQLLQTRQERTEIVQQALYSLQSEPAFAQFVPIMASKSQQQLLIDTFLSYDVIESLLHDVNVEDIIINGTKPIYIHHALKGFVATDKCFESMVAVDHFVRKLFLFANRSYSSSMVDIELTNLAGRANIIQSSFGAQITITKAKVDPLSILDLVAKGSLSFTAAAQLWMYVEGCSMRPANILIAGGPGTGKTTLLNALFSFIPVNERLVVIEDTLELNTFLEESCSRLESSDQASLADLVRNALRMRPERIVVGEVRGEEAGDMMTAMNIGKYCLGTIHALSPREAVLRLQNHPMNVPESLISLIDVIVVLKRMHVDGQVTRVIDDISETSGMEQNKILLSQVFKYNIEQKTLEQATVSTVYRDRLAAALGQSPKDILVEIAVRARVLQALFERNATTIKEVTTFARYYYTNPRAASLSLGLDFDQLRQEFAAELSRHG